MAEEFQLQFTALKTKKAKIADGRQSRKKKSTIDFGLTKELDYANFGVETKTAEKKEDVEMNIGTFVVLVIVACIVGLAARKVWKDKKSGKSCSSCGGSCGGCSGCHPAPSKKK